MAAETYGYVTKWGSYGAGDGQFSSPENVAVDSSGVYVADTLNDRIEKFSSDGKTLLANWGSQGTGVKQFELPWAIAVDSSGNVYVADSENHRIEKFTSDGTYVTQWGSAGSDPGQFNYPLGIAVDSSDNVYVADSGNSRIQKFTSDGTYVTQWGSTGSDPGQFDEPIGIAIDSSDNVYVADTYHHRIEKFTSDGKTLLANWGSQGTGDKQFEYPRGIAVDSSGYVYVMDTNNNRIEKFTSDGTYVTQWGSRGSADGQFYYPRGIAVDFSGNVYVADTGNSRVQKFAKVQTTGSIAVTSTPTGAGIYLDSADTGMTTVSGGTILADKSAGLHTVKVTLAGYQDASQQVSVTAGTITPADFQLIKILPETGSIQVASVPSGAEIYLDGKDTGQKTVRAGTMLIGVSAGPHDIIVKLDCSRIPDALTVTVSPTTVATADFSLTSDGTCTSTPEFPSTTLPAAMIIGFLGIVTLIWKTREH
jgi:DNA-binding beta-propeller fold protein YncE